MITGELPQPCIEEQRDLVGCMSLSVSNGLAASLYLSCVAFVALHRQSNIRPRPAGARVMFASAQVGFHG